MPVDKKNKALINRLIQIAIIIGIAVFVYFKIVQQEVSLGLEIIRVSFDDHLYIWMFILILMPVNWFMEILKWKKLAVPIVDLSYTAATSGVLSGLSFSFITPHAWGDYIGRILVLRDEERGRLVGALFFGKMAQLFITVVAGILGIIMYVESWPFLYFWYFLILFLLAILISFNRSVYRIFKPYLFKVRYFFRIIKSYSAKKILYIIGISLTRYCVFTLQFLLIMLILEIDISLFLMVSGITWIFLIKSIVPSFNFLSDLGIREVSAVLFFENFMADTGPVISATFVIWIINILLPALIGTLFIFKIKTFR